MKDLEGIREIQGSPFAEGQPLYRITEIKIAKGGLSRLVEADGFLV